MLLEKKNAVIYGAAGSIGSAVARAFAAEGATVAVTGRTLATLEKLAAEIEEAGGRAEPAVIDAYDEAAVEAHLAAFAERAGSVDVSLNLATRGDAQGTPLTEMSVEDLVRPITNGITTTFITARAAARRMAEQGSGVVIVLNSGSAGGSPWMGGTGPADAAVDAFIRNLATEIGPTGARAVGIWTAGVPETLSPEKLKAVRPDMELDDAAFQGLLGQLAGMRLLGRSPSLANVVSAAVYLASDQAASTTGSFLNVTSGLLPS